jgi:hypothetical protein
MSRPRVFVVVVALVAWSWTLATVSGCKRACETASNCRRTCECLNTETDRRNECTIAFRCEGDTESCEDAFDTMSCDQQCADYEANALCGVARCLSDNDCTRDLECDLVDLNGQPTGQKRACTVAFGCDQALQACAVRSIASDAELCAAECNTAL